jgi:membrane protease subunit (stomatin/prohibitin family)
MEESTQGLVARRVPTLGEEHDIVGLMDKIRGEFIDIVQWTDDTRDTIVWRFPRHENEIKMNAKLVVRESQVAVFVNEGTIADVFKPGTHTLETQNLPVLSTLKGWKYGFDSPFKAEVYFVSTRQFTDLKWGTQNPAMMRDAEFGMVRVRAFGTYSIKAADPAVLLRELVGTDPEFKTDEVDEFVRQSVVSRVVTALATSGVAVLDLAAHQNEIAGRLAVIISEDLNLIGLQMPRFIIENVSLPPEVEATMDKRTSMGVLGDLDKFTKFQAATAITQAAQNLGGIAGAGVGIGIGATLGAQLAQALQPGAASPAVPSEASAPAGISTSAPTGPPPLPVSTQWYLGEDGKQVGPLTPSEIQARVTAGTGTPDTLVWRSGMEAWARLGDMPELQAAHGSTPPPLPA